MTPTSGDHTVNKLLPLLAAMLLALTACGSGGEADGSADERTAKKSIADDFLGQGDTPLDRKSAACIADNIVDEVGLEQLQEYGLIDEELHAEDSLTELQMSGEDAQKSADSFTDCVDSDTLFDQVFSQGAQEIPAKTRQCLRTALDEATFNEIMKASFMGDDEAGQQALEPALECMMTSPTGTPPARTPSS